MTDPRPRNLRQHPHPPASAPPDPTRDADPTAPPEGTEFERVAPWGWIWWSPDAEGPAGLSVRTEPVTRWTRFRDWFARWGIVVFSLGTAVVVNGALAASTGRAVPDALVLHGFSDADWVAGANDVSAILWTGLFLAFVIAPALLMSHAHQRVSWKEHHASTLP